ncbi:uncharacterized protein LOC141786060 [Halichoeres trimaculatus]|uniref:uncharacterized protein LOC141786060 n=1 Tax=Halichoeres trimaculatus TaxID=147232 RepID=UPI003D9F39A4
MDENTSPPSSPASSSTLTPQEQNCQPRMHSSPQPPFYEELFCTPGALVPLAAGALMTTSPGPHSDVVKQGYLGKLERSHRRYFVLRGGSHTGPSRLEWYKSQEKFTAAGAAVLFSSGKQGLVYLRCCLGVSRMSSSKKGHTVTLYAKDQTVVLVVEEQREQEEWYLAIKKLMEEERTDEERDEEDDGYCTLPPAAFFKEVWPVTVKPRGLGGSKAFVGESRLCLTAKSLILIRVGAHSDLRSVTIPLLSVRRFGHLDGLFFLELGRSAPNGPGEIWMEAKDQGNPTVAQHIHEVIREAVKNLRVLPDFSRSPTSDNQLQNLLISKRCRPKYRDKPAHMRPLGSRLGLPEALSYLELSKSSLSSTLPLKSHPSEPETSSYVEMKTDNSLTVKENYCRTATMLKEEHSLVTASGEEEEEEEKEERLGYMRMSPQTSSAELQQNDYMTMASPQKHNQTSFDSSISDRYSPEHQPHRQTRERYVLVSKADRSKRSNSCSESQVQLGLTSTPKKNENRPCRINLFPTNGQGYNSPNAGRLQAAPPQPIRRSRLSSCLPSCFKSEDGS